MPISGTVAYSRKRALEGTRLFRAVLLCLLYGVLAAVAAVAILVSGSVPLAALLLCLLLIAVCLTLPLFRETVDYEIVGGVLRVYRVYGNARSRLAFEGELKAMTEIAPLTAETEKHFRALGVSRTLDLLSGADSPEAYYALYPEGDRVCALLFDCDEAFARMARFVNHRAFAG